MDGRASRKILLAGEHAVHSSSAVAAAIDLYKMSSLHLLLPSGSPSDSCIDSFLFLSLFILFLSARARAAADALEPGRADGVEAIGGRHGPR
jgi:hypothetical protein